LENDDAAKSTLLPRRRLLQCGAAAASAYDTLQVGPPVGAKIPHNLKTVDHNNQHQDFKSLAHSRGPVILFSRSVDW